MKQDGHDTVWEISQDKTEELVESTLSSNIEDTDLDHRHVVLHHDQARHYKTIRTTRGPYPKKWRHADTVNARTPLPNLRHPVVAIAPQLLKREKSAINISCKSDVVQALPLDKAGGDQNVPQPKAGGDHNVPQRHKATVEVAKRFM